MYFVKQSLGTTLIAMRLKDCIILAADSQTSSGNLVTNRVADKISILSEFIVCCRSGAAADTQYMVDCLQFEINKHFNETRQQMNIRAAAQILREICYKEKNLNYGFICAGWDHFNGCQIYSINQGGALFKHGFLLAGSGSIYINSFCDANYREEMNYSQSREFIIKAISMAMNRDGSSGGIIKLCTINHNEIKKEVIIPFLKLEKIYFSKKFIDFIL
jgi:20S proteasome subunit beta 1